MLTIVSIALVALFSRSDSGYLPVFEGSVAVVRVEGPITDSRSTVKLLKRLRKNALIKAIVLRLETPGGGIAASEEIYREALKATTENKKLVVASMGDVAASGGYYIASASSHIYATSGTITGSIGVISPMFNVKDTMRKLGISENSVTSGEHKNTGSPFDEQTITERALVQGVINDMYRQFFTVVLQARHVAVGKAAASGSLDAVINASQTKAPGGGIEWATFTTGTVASAIGASVEAENGLRRLADGRIYTGEQALRVGLVDSIGTLQDAVDYAGKKTGIGTDPPVVDRTPKSDVSSWLGASVRRFINEVSAPANNAQLRSPF